MTRILSTCVLEVHSGETHGCMATQRNVSEGTVVDGSLVILISYVSLLLHRSPTVRSSLRQSALYVLGP